MKERPESSGACVCPYCDEEIKDLNLPFCQSCGQKVLRCSHCGSIITSAGEYCPQCGERHGQVTT